MFNPKTQLQTYETSIKAMGEQVTHLEKRLHGVNLWIHKLQEKTAELDLRLKKIEIDIAEKED